MHHGGGSGDRKNALRWATVRQRGAATLACNTRLLVSAKISHSHAFSPDAVTMRLPSGLNAALNTRSLWPSIGSAICIPVSASHSRAVLSEDAVTMRLPSGLNTALDTSSA